MYLQTPNGSIRMATKKRSKGRGQLSFNLGINDERIPKLVGIFCLFFAFYLFIAFSSYLFTWQVDQDRVLRFSWGLLLEGDVEMANWLGRLGAIVSNMFFYWGFGLPSYIFVFLTSVFGVALIKRTPLSRFMGLLRYSVLVLVFLALFLDFIFSNSEFPWGGAFGKGVGGWLNNFVGDVGMVTLFIFLVFGFLVWIFNPNFNELTMEKLWFEIKSFFQDLRSGRIFQSNVKTTPRPKALPSTLRPTNQKTAEEQAAVPLTTSGENTSTNNEATDSGVPSEAGAKLTAAETLRGEQLAFDMPNKKDRVKPKSLDLDSELEINIPSGQPTNKEDDNDRKAPTPEEGIAIAMDNRGHNEPYDPTLELSSYEHPVLQLLQSYDDQKFEIDRSELEQNKDQIIETLLNYKIEIIKIKATIGPTVTLYEIVPAPGVRISRIKNLEDDIALSLSALGIRIIAPIPGKGTIGIEVPNKNKQMVALRELLVHEKFKRAKMDLPIALGKTISDEVFVADLAKMPHLLIAGATGQGKSVGVNVILMSLLYKKHPSQVKFVLIDPKKVELFPYSKIEKHFLACLPGLDEAIVTDTTKVVHTLNSLLIEMDERYNLLKKAHSRNIREYNQKFVSRTLNPNKGHRFMPFIVLVIDEFADLIMTAGKEIELPIGRLAQLSRAVGIHLIIATQRPSVNIITGVIKANFPARIAFKVTAKVDSRTIIDTGGADRLVGRGDMLLSFGSDLIRLQCAFVDTPEVEKVIDFISTQQGYPTPFYLPEFHGDDATDTKSGVKISELDDLFQDAAHLVVQNQHGSTSMLQRRMKLG